MSTPLTAPEELRRAWGQGRYVADRAGGALQCAFVRSPYPHARIVAIRTEAARAVPGVVAVVTGADLRDEVHPIVVEGTGQRRSSWRVLPDDAARFVGEAVAVVVAGTRAIAEDAADLVELDWEERPAVLEAGPGPVAVSDEMPDNVFFEVAHDTGGVEAALAGAPHVVDRTFHMPRQTALPLENRGVLAEPAENGGLVVTTSTQIPPIVRRCLGDALGLPPAAIRVVTPDVGGGFGLKLQVFPEEVLIPALARHLGRPVAWIEDRRENLVASAHAHDQTIRVRAGFDGEGHLRAVDATVDVDAGAHSVYPLSAALDASTGGVSLFGAYRFDHFRFRARGLASNRCPAGAYRGVGVNGAVFATERTMDLAASVVGLSPVELRRRNLPTGSEFPRRTASGRIIDSGAYRELLEALLAEPGLVRWRERRATEPGIGIGFATFNEHSGTGTSEYRARGVDLVPGMDAATVRVTGNGRVLVLASAAEAGQRHHETYRLLVERELGVAGELVDVVEGDTGLVPDGSGTFASRHASGNLEAIGRALAELESHLTELGLSPVGRDAAALREGRSRWRAGSAAELEATATVDMRQVYPAGAHCAVVQVDPSSLVARVLAYFAVEDCGTVVNRAAVEEQVVGGIVMGIGKVLYEEIVYDESGIVRTSTLLDYPVAVAADLPEITVRHLPVPTGVTRYGTKGAAEAGTIGACGAIPNAIVDALRPAAAELVSLPATPRRLDEAVRRSAS